MKYLLSLALTFLLFFLASCDSDNSNDKLVFATSADYPPFEYRIREELVGFEIELGKLIAQELGMEAKFKETQFSTVLTAVRNGMADAAISTITITTAREKNFDFSVPYYVESLAIIFPKDFSLENKAALKGKKIACQLGTTMEMWLKNNVKEAEVITTDTNPQAIETLKAGYVDGVLIDTIQASGFTKKNPQLSYKVIAQADTGYAIAFKKDSPLKDKVNQALRELEKQGKIKELRKKYLEVQ